MGCWHKVFHHQNVFYIKAVHFIIRVFCYQYVVFPLTRVSNIDICLFINHYGKTVSWGFYVTWKHIMIKWNPFNNSIGSIEYTSISVTPILCFMWRPSSDHHLFIWWRNPCLLKIKECNDLISRFLYLLNLIFSAFTLILLLFIIEWLKKMTKLLVIDLRSYFIFETWIQENITYNKLFYLWVKWIFILKDECFL